MPKDARNSRYVLYFPRAEAISGLKIGGCLSNNHTFRILVSIMTGIRQSLRMKDVPSVTMFFIYFWWLVLAIDNPWKLKHVSAIILLLAYFWQSALAVDNPWKDEDVSAIIILFAHIWCSVQRRTWTMSQLLYYFSYTYGDHYWHTVILKMKGVSSITMFFTYFWWSVLAIDYPGKLKHVSAIIILFA